MHEKKPHTGPPRPLDILIVDEHLLFCTGMVRLLDGDERITSIRAATTLAEGVRLLKRFGPDVLLLDPCLPDAGPFEAARRIRELAASPRMVFLDGALCEMHVRAALHAGALGYWTKHCSPDQILDAIELVAQGKPAFCRRVEPFLVKTRRGLRFHPSGKSSALERLSPREMEVLLGLARGMTIRAISERMRLAHSTIDNHKSRLMRKLEIHRAVDLVSLAFREGLVE